MAPFCSTDQINFLCMLWNAGDSTEQSNLKSVLYANKCLELLKNKINMGDEDIAGITLHCLLVGEAFADEAIEFCISGNATCVPGTKIESVSNLFEKFINKKLEIYSENYAHQNVDEKDLNDLLEAHMFLALRLLFPNCALKTADPFEENGNLLQAVLNVGLVSGNATAPSFIHRTFAEYFVALLFLGINASEFCGDLAIELFHLKFATELNSSSVTKHINQGICYFPNSFLETYNSFRFSQVLSFDKSEDNWDAR